MVAAVRTTLYSIAYRNDVVRVYDDICETITSWFGTGGNNVPLILDSKTYCIAGNIIARQPKNGGNGKGYQEDVAYTLNTADRHAVASTLRAGAGAIKHMSDLEGRTVVQMKRARRLTPLECERLQGLPDNYTLIDAKCCSDTARYKALGNGMAQPCADYVIGRIVEVVKEEA